VTRMRVRSLVFDRKATPHRSGIKEFALLPVGGEGSKPRARHQHQAGVAGAAPGARLEGQTVVRRSIKSLTVSSTPACTRRPDDDLAPQSHIWTATTSWHERAKLETTPWRAGGSFAPTQSLHHNPTSFSPMRFKLNRETVVLQNNFGDINTATEVAAVDNKFNRSMFGWHGWHGWQSAGAFSCRVALGQSGATRLVAVAAPGN